MTTPLVRNRRLPRHALTLIELVVVMVILAAVAGIVLPLLPNMVTRAHTSSGATNVGEVAKAIQTHEALHAAYPTNFDSIVLTPGGTGTLPAYLPAPATDFVVTPLTDETAEGLASAGITSVKTMVAPTTGDWSPTFYPYGADATVMPAETAIAEDVELAMLSTAAEVRLGLPTGPTYVVLGVGAYTSMQGKTLQEAPVHFADSPAEAPGVSYSRFAAVFQITNSAGDALERARLAQVVAFHDDGVVGVNGHLAEYHAAAAN
jgi:prepilin-type N-terminal cleavage/methylation domain-containing protein